MKLHYNIKLQIVELCKSASVMEKSSYLETECKPGGRTEYIADAHIR